MNFVWAANKRFCILGLGRSGLAAARTLHAHKFPVFVWDDSLPVDAHHQLAQDHIPVRDLLTYEWQPEDILIVSPGIPHTLPRPHPIIARAKAAGVPLTVDVDVFLRSLPAETWVIGVTGTNGKSTTVSLLHHLFQTADTSVALGGNFGIPVFALETKDIYVLELSSYQLELMETCRLNVAVLLNITPDHLERHGSIPKYGQVKNKIFELLAPQGKAILGIDTPLAASLLRDDIIPISTHKHVKNGIYALNYTLFIQLQGHAAQTIDLKNAPFLKGQHNAENAAAASAAFLETSQVCHDTLQKGLESFPGLVHRQQQIEDTGHVIFINDSKATNCDSALKALECYNHIYWLVGGKLKENDFSLDKFQPYLHKIKAIFTFGEGGPVFQEAFQSLLPTFACKTLKTATQKAYDMAKVSADQGVVLLSPAAASYDQFRDFEHRGETFGHIVHQILHQERIS